MLFAVLKGIIQGLVPRSGFQALRVPSGLYRADIGATKDQVKRAWQILRWRNNG